MPPKCPIAARPPSRQLGMSAMRTSAWARRRLSRAVRPGSVLLLLALCMVMAAGVAHPLRAAAAANPVVVENQQPGTNAWKITGPVSDDTANQIKGYASATSVNQNDSITFYVSVNPIQAFTMDIYRMGWYGGLGGRLRIHLAGFQGVTQQPCTPDPTTGLIACDWTASEVLTIPSDWTSGVYLALLTNALGYQTYIIFVVNDGRAADFLYQEAINTSEAYNNWPDNGITGKSLYTFNSYGPNTVSGDARAVKVSFDRPFTRMGAGLFLTYGVGVVRWLEQSGYDVTYATDVDTHVGGSALLQRSRAFLVGGHDEYWTKEMYDAAQGARDAGVNLGFLAADELGWQVRYEASTAGTPNR